MNVLSQATINPSIFAFGPSVNPFLDLAMSTETYPVMSAVGPWGASHFTCVTAADVCAVKLSKEDAYVMFHTQNAAVNPHWLTSNRLEIDKNRAGESIAVKSYSDHLESLRESGMQATKNSTFVSGMGCNKVGSVIHVAGFDFKKDPTEIRSTILMPGIAMAEIRGRVEAAIMAANQIGAFRVVMPLINTYGSLPDAEVLCAMLDGVRIAWCNDPYSSTTEIIIALGMVCAEHSPDEVAKIVSPAIENDRLHSYDRSQIFHMAKQEKQRRFRIKDFLSAKASYSSAVINMITAGLDDAQRKQILEEAVSHNNLFDDRLIKVLGNRAVNGTEDPVRSFEYEVIRTLSNYEFSSEGSYEAHFQLARIEGEKKYRDRNKRIAQG